MLKMGDVVRTTTNVHEGLTRVTSVYGIHVVPTGSVGIITEVVRPAGENRYGGEFWVTFFLWPEAAVDVWGEEIAAAGEVCDG